MISNSEKHFVNNWLEQKSGPRWKYYLQFTIAWTIISFLVIFFLLKLFTCAWETGGQNLIFIIIGASIFSGCIVTHIIYTTNEKKYKKIVSDKPDQNTPPTLT